MQRLCERCLKFSSFFFLHDELSELVGSEIETGREKSRRTYMNVKIERQNLCLIGSVTNAIRRHHPALAQPIYL